MLKFKQLTLSLGSFCLLSAPVGADELVAAGDPSVKDLDAKCKVECKDPHAACTESARVLDTLKVLANAYSKGDIKTYEEYLADGCTTFNETSNKLITGKQAVLEDLKHTFTEHAPGGTAPLISLTIDQPYAKVKGDTAVVTFIAIKETGGKNPVKLEGRCTDVFVHDKSTDKWKKLHFRGSWKKIS